MKKFMVWAFFIFMIVFLTSCKITEKVIISSEPLPPTSHSKADPQSKQLQKLETTEPDIFELSSKLNFSAESVVTFQYEILSATEENQLVLTGENAINATKELLGTKVSYQDPKKQDPWAGGAHRYTLVMENGESHIITNCGMLSIDKQENIYKVEDKVDISIPENAEWEKYEIDIVTGERKQA